MTLKQIRGLIAGEYVPQQKYSLNIGEVKDTAKIKSLDRMAERKTAVRKLIQNRMNGADMTPKKLEKLKIFSQSTYYSRLKNAGEMKLSELWQMEQAGIKFSDAELLTMFGREGG